MYAVHRGRCILNSVDACSLLSEQLWSTKHVTQQLLFKMFSRFGKTKKGFEDSSQNEYLMNKDVATSEKGMKPKKISRRSRGRNIVQTIHSDYDDEMKSVASDNPHFYTRSRSSVRYEIIYISVLFIFFYLS